MPGSSKYIHQYFAITQLAVDLHNSNPENKPISFTQHSVLLDLKAQKQSGSPYIVGGYLAAAYYGCVRTSFETELVVAEAVASHSPFIFHVVSPKEFDVMYSGSTKVSMLGYSFQILSLDALIFNFQKSSDNLKQIDARLLREIKASFA